MEKLFSYVLRINYLEYIKGCMAVEKAKEVSKERVKWCNLHSVYPFKRRQA